MTSTYGDAYPSLWCMPMIKTGQLNKNNQITAFGEVTDITNLFVARPVLEKESEKTNTRTVLKQRI